MTVLLGYLLLLLLLLLVMFLDRSSIGILIFKCRTIVMLWAFLLRRRHYIYKLGLLLFLPAEGWWLIQSLELAVDDLLDI